MSCASCCTANLCRVPRLYRMPSLRLRGWGAWGLCGPTICRVLSCRAYCARILTIWSKTILLDLQVGDTCPIYRLHTHSRGYSAALPCASTRQRCNMHPFLRVFTAALQFKIQFTYTYTTRPIYHHIIHIWHQIITYNEISPDQTNM
jgi:hypothetical protein